MSGLAAEVDDAIFDHGVCDGVDVRACRGWSRCCAERGIGRHYSFHRDSFAPIQAASSETVSRRVRRGTRKSALMNFRRMRPTSPLLVRKAVRTSKAVEVDQLTERAGFVVILEDSAKPEHSPSLWFSNGRLRHHRVVLRTKSCSSEQKSQNLRIGLGGPAGQENKATKISATRRTGC